MNIDQIISTVAGEHLDYKNYKNNTSEITKRGGVIIGGARVPFSKIDLDNEIYQTRHLTKDTGHISILASDIAENGIEKLPILSWNEKEGKFNVLSGHHRTRAIDSNNKQDSKRSMIPAIIVKFEDEIQREFFLQSENNHRPLKVAGKADAELFLTKMKKMGYFDSFVSEDGSAIINEAKNLLKQYHGKLHHNTRNKIIDTVWSDKSEISQIKMYDAREFKKEVKKLANLSTEYASGSWLPNGACLISSVPRAIPAALVTVLNQSIKEKQNQTDSFTRQKIKIFTYFDQATNVGSVKKLREDFLKEKTLFQTEVMDKCGLATIHTIQFLEQIDDEDLPLSFVWNPQTCRYEEVKDA